MFLFPHVPAKLLIYISSNSIGNFIQKQNTLMDTNSRNWKWARKNHLLAVVSLFLLQNHLHVSVMFVEAKTSVSVHVQLQVLAPPFFFPFFEQVLIWESFQVHIVYMGQKKYDDPETTKKSHHKMVSTLLGRYG